MSREREAAPLTLTVNDVQCDMIAVWRSCRRSDAQTSPDNFRAVRAPSDRGTRAGTPRPAPDTANGAARGFTSPYLKPFVVARVNYTRFSRATSFDFDEALDKIVAGAQKFNVDRVKHEDVVRAGGAPDTGAED